MPTRAQAETAPARAPTLGDAIDLERAARAERTAPMRVPTPVVGIGVVVIIATSFMSVLGGRRVGVTTDEPTHVDRLTRWFADGWYAPAWMSDPVSSGDAGAYGPVAALWSHLVSVIMRVETWGAVSESAAAYDTRHNAVAILGGLGLVATAGVARTLTGSWRWGILAAAMLSAVPLWSGHSMFNVKDLPTAAGVVLTLWGLVVLSRPLSYIGPKGVAGAVGLLAVGGIISVGTRPGTWLLVSGLALTLLAGTWWTVTPKIGLLASSRLALARLAGLALAAGAAMAVLGLVYPRLFGSPIEALIRSARVSSDYGGWSGWTLTAGVVHGQPPPWWYLPSWFGAQLPLLVLVLGAVGAAVVLVSALRVAARRGHPAQDVEIGWILVLVAGTAAPVVAVVSGATVYTGIRQLLFVLPPIALLAVRGLATALRVADPVSLKSPHVRGVAWVAVVLGLLAPTFDQARLFPYGYVYLNEMATLRPVDGSWPTDYWRASFRELLVQVPSTGPLACSLAAEQDGVRNRGAALRFEERRVSACSRLVDPARDGRDLRGSLLGGEFWYLRQNQFGRDLPSNCVVEGEVVRTLRGQQLLMSYLARCTDPTHLPN